MKVNSTPLLVALLASSVFISCKKDNTQSEAGIHYQLRSSQSVSGGQTTSSFRTESTAGTINWTSGFANVSQLKFEAESGDKEVEYKSNIQQHVDLFAPLSSLGTVQLPAGKYEEVEFKVVIAPTATEPALELKGTYNGTPVVFRITSAYEIKGEKDNVTIASNTDYNAITNMQLALLTRGISDTDMTNATKTNGEILITSSINSSLYNMIIKNLKDTEGEEDFEDD